MQIESTVILTINQEIIFIQVLDIRDHKGLCFLAKNITQNQPYNTTAKSKSTRTFNATQNAILYS